MIRTLIVLCGLLGSTLAQSQGATPRIIGGEPASIADHPWMAALTRKDATSPSDGFFCGASLIDPQWVVTAAHCVSFTRADEISVLLGTDDLSAPERGESMDVTAIILRPDWLGENESASDFPDDIALLKLAEPSRQAPITPALGSQSSAYPAGTPVTVSGWGTQSADGFDYPDQLQAVDLAVTDDEACDAVYDHPGLTENFICAAAPERDACYGDSGGPLSTLVNGSPVLVGIVSGGEECASATHPGIYTRVSAFESFIDEAKRQTSSTDAIAFFNTTIPGRTSSAVLNYHNLSSDVTLVLSDLRTSDPDAMVSVGAENCSTSELAPQSSCTIELNWTPAESSGRQATILESLFKVDVFDGSDTRTLDSILLGISLAPVPAEFAQTLDAPEGGFYVDGGIDWEVISDESAQGGEAIQTIDLGTAPILATEFAAISPTSGTMSFNYRGNASVFAVLVDGELNTVFEGDLAPSEQWITAQLEVGEQSLVEWIIIPAAEDASLALDAITLPAAGVPAEDDTNGNPANQDGTGATTAAGAGTNTNTGAGAGADANSGGHAAGNSSSGGSSGSGAFWPSGLLLLAGLSFLRRRK